MNPCGLYTDAGEDVAEVTLALTSNVAAVAGINVDWLTLALAALIGDERWAPRAVQDKLSKTEQERDELTRTARAGSSEEPKTRSRLRVR